MTNPPLLTSRTIGVAENALRAILTQALIGTGLDYHRWVGLNLIAISPSPLPIADFEAQLTDGLKIGAAEAAAVADDLRTQGLVANVNGMLSTTAEGASLYQKVSGAIRPISQQIYEGLDVNDLVVAHRVLSAITDRANALLAG